MTTNRSNETMQSGQKSQNQKSEERAASKSSSSSKSSGGTGPGRGWHGDPEGHARAGSQSHKND